MATDRTNSRNDKKGSEQERAAARPMRRWVRLVALAVLALVGLLILFILFCNVWVIASTRKWVYSDPSALPPFRAAVLLGAGGATADGKPNPYFTGRVEAAARLYLGGHVRHILASGSNPTPRYNEPPEMRRALIDSGVPASAVTLDYAGFRTLDSVVRAWKVFGLRRFLVVSQEYHNFRAVFLARHYGLDAWAYSAPEVPEPPFAWRRMREVLARVKAVLDLYVLKTEPRFLGDPVDLPFDSPSQPTDREARP